MNETAGKTASCLAVTEKKAHRPGGCVGIFFKLFDWNRRFAKKKIFSRKLLPPVRAKASKKFEGDEKMPKSKPHLIADENSGGFPNVRKNGKHGGGDSEQKHETRAPSLVARLMGLESMPAVHRDKSKKATIPGDDARVENLVSSPARYEGDDLMLEKENAKVEPRPQKMQKTGQLERHAVTRFGAEALQIKGVFSRSRKHHHSPKLAAPVKSPRISSARNAARTSRLIDAATKILEPGLQATNKAKCALTYSSLTPYVAKNGVRGDGMEPVPSAVLKQSGYNMSSGNSLMGQMSCKTCGNLLEDVGTRPNLEDQQHVCPQFSLDLVDAYPQELQKGKPRPIVPSIDHGRGATFQRSQEWSESVASKEVDSLQTSSESNVDGKTLPQEGQNQWPLSSHQSNCQRDEQFPVAFKHQTETSNHIALGRDKVFPSPKFSNVRGRRASSVADSVGGTKNFVAMNKSVRNHTKRSKPKVATKVEDSLFDTDKRSCNQKDDSSSQPRSSVRKRRTSMNGQADSSGFATSAYGRQSNARCNGTTGNGTGTGTSLTNRVCLKTRLASKGADTGTNGNKDTGVISFTFNSPLRQKTGNFMEKEGEGCDQHDIIHSHDSYQRKLISDENNAKAILQEPIKTLTGDHLSILLEQKLKELTYQEEDDLTTGSTLPKRSTAMILQDLITALTAPQDVPLTSPDPGFKSQAMAEGISVGFSCYGDHLSPGSVLEASFSNDSCVSSSLDDSSGYRLHLDSMDYSNNYPQPTDPDVDLVDSATTLDKGMADSGMVIDLLNKISMTLCSINHAGLRLSGKKLIYVKEVILNAELLFGNLPLFDSDCKEDLLLCPFLHEEMEPPSEAIWTEFSSLLGFEKSKDNNQLKGFLFDCAVECLDTRYGRYCNLGFKAWRSLPLHTNSKMLMQEVEKEIRRWTQFVGMVPDELIEWEMSHSLGKWTDLDIEAFETGIEIDSHILQILLEEVAVDLWEG
ncbi:hypothetical protein SLE2022_189040 [Rubroshorea leprosula]